MGIGYNLINHTKREIITFIHLPASTARELAGNPVTAAVTTWYLLQSLGDRIAFISDTDPVWPFPDGSVDEAKDYRDVTDDVVVSLIDAGILSDDGRETFWSDEPEVFVRRLRNVWFADNA